MSEGPFSRNDRQARAFRDWLEEQGGTSEKMEKGSFQQAKSLRRTGGATRLVVIDKGEADVVAHPTSRSVPRQGEGFDDVPPESLVARERAAPYVPTFYSKAERVITQKMPTRASSEQVRNILKPESGVKPDELKWSGLDAFLQTKDSFTKEDVQSFIRQNQVHIQEVRVGDADTDAVQRLPELKRQWQIATNTVESAALALGAAIRSDRIPTNMVVKAVPTVSSPSELSVTYWTPENKIAQTVLKVPKTTAPKAAIEAVNAALNDQTIAANQYFKTERKSRPKPVKFRSYTQPGGKNYREVLLTWPQREGRAIDEEAERSGTPRGLRSAGYISPHFQDAPNIIAHLRMTDRTGPNGKRIYS